MKIKFLIIFIMTIVFLTSTVSISAENIGSQIKDEVKTKIMEKKADKLEIKNEINNQLMEKTASRVGAIKNFFSQRAMLNRAVVTAKSDNQVTLEKDGKVYTVNLDESTKIYRRFFGKSSFEEIEIGHLLSVYGKWVDENHEVIEAKIIKNLSLQKRFGVFVGEVTAMSENEITINTVHRGDQKAIMLASTKIVNRKMVSISQLDIQIGHTIRVKGLWDNMKNTIEEVSQIKDYSLPEKVDSRDSPAE